ncbi:hypothetical protein, partial [Stella sp.]|uniref:hypothetical protein n=1 Tax=Stella sp. TaxID=2912054 RepID=UPI0035B02B23
ERDYRPDLVISRFTRRKPDDDLEHRFVKSIVRPELVEREHIHLPGLRDGRFVHSDLSDLAEMEAPKGRAARTVIGDVRLHHYMLKSAEVFEAKRRRGGAAATSRRHRLQRYGADFFSARDEAANLQVDETLAAKAGRVRELVAEMAEQIADRVGRDRLEQHYAFLKRATSVHFPADHALADPPARGGRRIYVHIGLHKTGTTSLQSYIARNRDNLAAAGFHVPRTGSRHQLEGHHLLAWSLSGTRPGRLAGIDPDRMWNDLRNELERSACPNAILSAEDFSVLDDRQVRRLGVLLDGFEIVPIVILRRPGDLLEGAYRTHVALLGGSKPVEEFVREWRSEHFSYDVLLRRWRQMPGVSSMLIASYDDPAVGRDVVGAVLSWLGYARPPETGTSEPRLNSGVPAALIELTRWLRQSGAARSEIAGWLEAMSHLPFSRAQVGDPRLVPADVEMTLDAEYRRHLDQIEADPLLAPHVRGRLPRPEARRLRTIAGPADALLELPAIIAGRAAAEFGGSWLPRRLLPRLGPDLPAECPGNLDRPAAPGDMVTLNKDDPVVFSGWAFHGESFDAPWYLVLRPHDRTAAAELVAPLKPGTRRPDIAAAFPDELPHVTARSGFQATMDMAGVPCGRYELRVACEAAGGLVHARCRMTVNVGR